MHRTILAQRKARAMNTIVKSAKALAEKINVSDDLLARLKSVNVRDTETAYLFRLEGLAELLALIAADYGLELIPEEDFKVTEFIAPKETPEEPISEAELEGLSTRTSRKKVIRE